MSPRRRSKPDPVTYEATGYGASRIHDPQAWGEFITAWAQAHGGEVDPYLILDEISDPAHRFHGYIPEAAWDDAKAAREYRVGLVRNLIRSVNVRSSETEVRKAVHGLRTQTYFVTGAIVKSPTLLESAIAQALSRLRGAHDSLTDLLASAQKAGTLDVDAIAEALDWLSKAEGTIARLRAGEAA